MERMRELVQSSTSGSTELAASSEQMSKMSRGLLEFLDRFALADASHSQAGGENSGRNARRAAAGAQY
jgi:hypothetical protein